ncbi:porin family protein [Flavobacterium sp.]|uniref:porin family protein n=1 Tax=Flavobacterium sp. TaxID=239 RepID=UPI0035B0C3AC
MKNQFTKSALTFTFLLCSIFKTQAQAALLVLLLGDKIATEKFHLSIDAGTNFSTVKGLGSPSHGWYFGLGTHLMLNEKWSLAPEFKPLSYRRTTNSIAIVNYNSLLEDINYEISLNYIDIPVLLEYKITPSLFIGTGPQLSFITKANQFTSGKINSGNTISISENIKQNFNSFVFSLPLEIGYSLSDLRKGKGLDIKLRYDIGLSNIMTINNRSLRGNTLQLFISLPFINNTVK